MSTYKLRNGIFSKLPVLKKNLQRFEKIIVMKSRFINLVNKLEFVDKSWVGNEFDL